jgi:hypothetical protein
MQKQWVYSPSRRPKPKVPEVVKLEVAAKADELVESFLKPAFVKPPRKGWKFNYIVEIYTKWYRSYFYFCSKYACPGPNALSPFFESKFARLEYVGNRRFNLSFMRYTGEWVQIYVDMTLDKCLASIKQDPWFQP